ncbi:MAG: TRAP transporter large permease subunit [Proteobacteria bacterium]|nr:TRAP transporter large permease subunit [Pseudomonadota bacterium]
MSLAFMSLVILGGLVLLLALGIEIAPAMGIVAALGLVLFVHQPLDYFARAAFEIMNSFTFTAIPLFVFMGTIYANTGIVGGLFRGAEKMFGGLPGSLCSAMIVANAIFGAISGSSLAATATFGRICFPEMEKAGYDPKLSLGAIAISGTLSVLIPPSLILIVYGGWQDVSVARLFAGGVIPGIILAFFFVLTVTIMVLRNPGLAPQASTRKYTVREKLTALWDLFPFLVVITLVLGTTFTGIMTPTESASLGAFLSIVLALLFRKMTYTALKESMLSAVNISAMIAFVLFTARMLGQVFQYIGLTEATSAFMLGMGLGKYATLAIICILYLILGCFFDSLSMLVLTLPFVAPIVKNLGFDFIWFGVLYVVLAEIGLVTPPFGLNLFVLKGVVPKYEITHIFAGTLPFLISTVILLALMVLFPEIVLWLPRVLYAR